MGGSTLLPQLSDPSRLSPLATHPSPLTPHAFHQPLRVNIRFPARNSPEPTLDPKSRSTAYVAQTLLSGFVKACESLPDRISITQCEKRGIRKRQSRFQCKRMQRCNVRTIRPGATFKAIACRFC